MKKLTPVLIVVFLGMLFAASTCFAQSTANAELISNGSFETVEPPLIPQGDYWACPSPGSIWAGGAAYVCTATPWSGNYLILEWPNNNGPSPYPDGNQVLALNSYQWQGTATQSVSLAAGSYTLTFYDTQAGSDYDHQQIISVFLGDTKLAEFTPVYSWHQESLTFSVVNPGTYDLSFKGIKYISTYSVTAYIDAVSLVPAPKHEPDNIEAIGKAVKELEKVSPPIVVRKPLNELVSIAAWLAQRTINQAAGGDPSQLAQANQWMTLAAQDVASGNFDVAIEKYGKAWNCANNAMR